MNRILIIATLFLAACNSSKIIQNEVTPGIDFTKYKTFDFLNTQASGDTIPGRYESGLALVKQAVTNEMIKRGYHQSSSNPDLYINLGISVNDKTQTRETDWRTDGRMAYIGQRNYSWKSQQVVVGTYKEGILDVNIVDAAAKSMIWKATVKDVLPKKAKNLPATVNEAITNLFSKYPVSAK